MSSFFEIVLLLFFFIINTKNIPLSVIKIIYLMDVYLIHHKTQHNLFSIVVGVTREIEDTLKIKRVLLYPFGKRVNTENSILH